MRTVMPSAGRPAYYTVAQAAWILGVTPPSVYRAIRLGILPTTSRNGRRVVSAASLVRLLGRPVDASPDSGGAP
jgi:hypothetical protein